VNRLTEGLRFYWVGAAGYRLRPWRSPYLRWRLETFIGPAAANPGPTKFFRIMWQERVRIGRFLDWAAERRVAQLGRIIKAPE
jgi:hypothetical protein